MATLIRTWLGRILLASGLTLGALPMGASAALVVDVLDVDVTGILSVDPQGDPLNETLSHLLPGNAQVTGIGWDVTLFADDPSFLSEMAVTFESSTVFYLTLRPGVGDDFPGTIAYSSGGIVDLVGLGLDFTLEPDGLLIMEFFESFDDFPDDWDGVWQSGTIQVRYQYDQPVTGIAEPSSLLLATLAVTSLAALRRRRSK